METDSGKRGKTGKRPAVLIAAAWLCVPAVGFAMFLASGGFPGWSLPWALACLAVFAGPPLHSLGFAGGLLGASAVFWLSVGTLLARMAG